jgi:hypothetical protein
LALNPEVLHLHTYFFFPFSIDQAAVMDEHPEIWRGAQPWFEKLQLSNIVLSLLHFANYAHQEYEATLDERMIVNSFVSLDRAHLPRASRRRKSMTWLSAACCMWIATARAFATTRIFYTRK